MSEPERRPFVSARTVAERAGVSRSAVSRTFTDGASVSEETRRKVLEAAGELGYHVNHLARGLRELAPTYDRLREALPGAGGPVA